MNSEAGTSAGATRSAPARLEPGAVLDGRFRLLEPIGRGGFGEVWRAEELLPNGAAIRQVALKVLAPESDLAAWTEEAKLLASFAHPSLVTILAAGLVTVRAGSSEVQAPFVAMELLSGETLASTLARKGRVPWRRALAWARDAAAALDVIHARGVVHLDLKPSNLFLTSAGAIKVLDFGIARRSGSSSSASGAALPGADDALGTVEFLAERSDDAGPEGAAGVRSKSASGPVVGTPGFIAPEIIEERPATCAADAYALAACVVQLATGLLPQEVAPAPAGDEPSKGAGSDVASSKRDRRGAWWIEVRHATSAGLIRDLEAPPSALPKGVAAMCRRLLALDPEARGVAPGGLRAILDAAWERPYGVPDPPYRGLLAFGPESEGMLFGRDDDIARLARELEDRATLILQGTSGSGKSSLAMAGLASAIAKRFAADGPDYKTVIVRPTADPDAALADALASITPGLTSVADVVAHAERHGIGVALVVDQLEELVTQASPERRSRFVRFLADASELPASAPLRLIGTLREDFTSGLFAIEPLGERLRDALRFIGPPTAAAVREIVGQPARLAGAKIEGLASVADDVQRELRTADGRLPLVALALAAWWRTRDEEDGGGATLRAQRWEALGGIRKIFADIADGVFADLDAAAKLEARSALLALGHDARTRRSLSRAELRASARDPAAFDRAADAFTKAGLLVEKGDRIEIVHEALLTVWDRLREWIADAQASRRIASALVEGARAWQDLGWPATRLPGPSEIALAELSLKEGGLEPGDEADLVVRWIDARKKRTSRERVGAAIAGLGVLLLIALAIGFWAKTVSVAQARADAAALEAARASEKALENERRAAAAAVAANAAKEDADKSRAAREKAAAYVKKQEEQFERTLADAVGETEKLRVKCAAIASAPRARTGGCPPGDKLCAAGQ